MKQPVLLSTIPVDKAVDNPPNNSINTENAVLFLCCLLFHHKMKSDKKTNSLHFQRIVNKRIYETLILNTPMNLYYYRFR